VDVEKEKAGISTKAEFIITTTWDLENTSDVDSWLRDPAGNILYFRDKEPGLMHLDRDDLGSMKDKFLLPDGTEIIYPYNQEIVTVRGIIPGWWVYNIHMYKWRTAKVTNVQVKMEKINPTIKTVFLKTFKIARQGEEITVARFKMDSVGNILDIDTLHTPLVFERLHGGGD